MPEQSPQINSAPMSSPAQLSGSRWKNGRRTSCFFLSEAAVFTYASKACRFVKDRQCHFGFDRFAVPKRGNEFCISEILQSRIAKTQKRRLLRNDIYLL